MDRNYNAVALIGGNNMEEQKYDALKLENQLCFPLYAASREVVKQYKPYLDKLDLTYTQYIVMLVMWEQKVLTTKELGQRLYLDSGTLTPLLKKMEAKGLLTRKRCLKDERNLEVTITEKGEQLRLQAVDIPAELSKDLKLNMEEATVLYNILYKLLGQNAQLSE